MKAEIIELDEVDSTNLFCKRLAKSGKTGDVIVVAARQTGGRGTKGRAFSSERGGLYLSLMRRYDCFDLSDTFKIMINSCVAVCKTLEAAGLSPVVKWPNDVLVGGKKISGTLIENTMLSHTLLSVVGIGINVNNPLPEELENIATSVSLCTGGEFPLEKLRGALVENLYGRYTIEDYKGYINWLGERVWLVCGEKCFPAVALDIDKDGSLLCQTEDGRKKINSAEMSLRLLCNTI